MENTVCHYAYLSAWSSAVSGMGAFVALFFLAWLTLIFVLGCARGIRRGARGAATRPTDRLIGTAWRISCWLPENPPAKGIRPFR